MGETIAIVDDTDGTRYALRRTLEEAGFSVVEGRCGADALRLAVTQPALMVLDVHMPDLMGPEVVKRLRLDPATRGIPVLHLSASFVTELDRASGLESGADAYLTEPVEPQLLIATVHALLRSRSAERVAERALKSRDEFLLVSLHDLRGALQALRYGLEAQLRRARDRDVDRQGLATGIERSVRELTGMTRFMQDLLDGARFEEGKRGLDREPADLAALAAEAVERYRAEAARPGSSITLLAPGPVAGMFDRMRVAQVLDNLLSNAIKYGAGKPIEVAVRADGNTAEITVTDHGVGIDRDAQARIFDRFERAESQLRPGSYGLGLWIVRQLVQAHGGTISVQSEPGQGSTFTVRLPL